MNRRYLHSCLAATATLALTAAAFADSAPGTVTMNLGSYFPGFTWASNTEGGGEFQATPSAGLGLLTGQAADASGTTFQTFCLELNEDFTNGTTYDALVTIGAVKGGSGATTDSAVTKDGIPIYENSNGTGQYPMDTISNQTAYLYYQFRTDNLAGYDYTDTAGRKQSGEALQEAFWTLENETTETAVDANNGVGSSVTSTYNTFMADASANADTWATNHSDQLNQVAVASLWAQGTVTLENAGGADQYYYVPTTAVRQDQLALLPTGNAIVVAPVPAAVWPGLAGLLLLGLIHLTRRARHPAIWLE